MLNIQFLDRYRVQFSDRKKASYHMASDPIDAVQTAAGAGFYSATCESFYGKGPFGHDGYAIYKVIMKFPKNREVLRSATVIVDEGGK